MDIAATLRRRDRQSFNWLYNRYAGMLFGAIRKMVEENGLAESLLQETFVEAWRSLDAFDPAKGGLFIWMLRIARSKVSEYIMHRDQKEQPGKNKKVVLDHFLLAGKVRTDSIFQLQENNEEREYPGIY